MRIMLLFCLLHLCAAEAVAAIQIPDADDYLIEIGQDVLHFTDSDGSFTPTNFRKELFQVGRKSFLGDGRRDWLYFDFENTHAKAKETRLWLKDGFYYDHIEIYAAEDGSEFHPMATISGSQAFSTRLHPSKNLVIPLQIPPHSSLAILIKIDNRTSISFTPILASSARYEEVSRRDYVIYGIIFGVIFINFIYNFLLYLRMREPSLVYYSGYLAGLCILFLAISGFDNEYLWFEGNTRKTVDLGSALVGCMITQFSRVFLKIPEFNSTLNRMMLLLIAVMGGMVVLSIFEMPPVFTSLIFVMDLLGLIACITAILVALHKGYQPARMFAVAWGAFLAGALMILFSSLGFVEANMFSQYGMQFGSIIQMAFLAQASADQMADKSRQITLLTEKRTAELEAEVASRTRAMREIVDNVASGFFLVDSQQKIQEGFTNSCLNIMGSGFSANQPLIKMLGLNPERKAHLSMTIAQVFEDFMPSSVSLSLLPSRIQLNEKVISLVGSVIRDDFNRVTRILFTVTDATALVAAEAQKKIDNALIGILRQRNAFTRFVLDFDSSLLKAKEFLKLSAQRELRQILHTIKGNASIYSLDELVHIIHEAEESATITEAHLVAIDQSMDLFFQQHLTELGIQRMSMAEEICQINLSRVKHFQLLCLQSKDLEELRSSALKLSDELRLKPAREFLIPLAMMARKVAENLSKAVDIVTEGSDIALDFDRIDPIIRNLSHLIRNSLSHGIENTEERLDNGKAARGVLRISISETPENYVFEVSDDGRGIHPERIAQAALKKGHVTQDDLSRMSDVEKQWLIFKASFSTATEVTEISGRGVGMDAVLESVKEVQATLTMESRVGEGSRFTITLERQAFKSLSRPISQLKSLG